jgi:hypothetical protein
MVTWTCPLLLFPFCRQHFCKQELLLTSEFADDEAIRVLKAKEYLKRVQLSNSTGREESIKKVNISPMF